MTKSTRAGLWTTLVIGGLLAACSSSGASGVEFGVQNISVEANQVWQINRPIDVTFTADVDFNTVSLNTIQIVDSSGRPATGMFSQALRANGTVNPRAVRFQPACPTRSDNSDAGLLPGGVFYTIFVVGSGTQGLSVRSTSGQPLRDGRSVTFRTPNSTTPQEIFLDPVPGPPGVRLRNSGDLIGNFTEMDATYLELGGDPSNRVYFQLDSATQTGQLPMSGGQAFPVPLNPYSVAEEQIAVLLFLNQPVLATEANISSNRVRFEYLDTRIPNQSEQWVPIATEVELEANCTETGAVLRLSPIGVLPQRGALRVNLRAAFSDLAGNESSNDRASFARMFTTAVNNPGTADPQRDADEILENFLVGGALDDSLEDLDAPLAQPRAVWNDGKLTAGFAFTGTGGTGGVFDWIVPPATQVILNTVSDEVDGGDGAITGTQPMINGLIDVRNVVIPAGSQVVFQGPNPVRILASGTVTIAGEIVLSGATSQGVGTLDTTNQAEPGAVGQCGGGAGGTGSFLTSQSTPRGGNGFGAFNRPNNGGEGGETSFHPNSKNARRGAGGGGGRLGPDVLYPLTETGGTGQVRFVQCQTLLGMDAEPGFDGGLDGTGAISQNARAQGGSMAPLPFVDADPDNNFFGSMLVDPGQSTERLVRGELNRAWAGSGGGAGGDAVRSNSFPLVPFSITGDEKGSGGGGGAGSLTILSIGDIVVEDGGRIRADGGRGGGGENTNFLDRVGGGSGGGSGGHVVLSSANRISISAQNPVVPGFGPSMGPFYDDPIIAGDDVNEHPQRPVSALGGQGGVGKDNAGGGRPSSPSTWKCDGIPKDRLELSFPNGGVVMVPPVDIACYMNLEGEPNGSVPGAGGDGGPGIIQLHVDSPRDNLLFPFQQMGGEVYGGIPGMPGTGIDVTLAMAPPPLGWRDTDDADFMLPFFGAESIAQSKWIRLGLGRLRPDPAGDPGDWLANGQVAMRFDGTDAMGSVDRTGTSVDLLNAIIGPDPLGASPTLPYVDPASGGATMVLDASGLVGANEVYKRNADLNRQLLVRLVDSANASNERRFSVVSAERFYDGMNDHLRVTVSTANGRLTDFVAAGTVQVSYVPTFFRVNTNGLLDQLPDVADIQVSFDATVQDSNGNPNPELAFSAQDDGMGGMVGFTEDIGDLNAQNWDFVRFRVLFDLNTDPMAEIDLNTPRPALEHLRIQLDY